MNIGIVGSPERAMAWEKHLREHHLFSDGTITLELENIAPADICFLIDDSAQLFQHLLDAVVSGIHTLLLAQLPAASDAGSIQQIYHASEEANVQLQFSHWTTLAPSSTWMSTKII